VVPRRISSSSLLFIILINNRDEELFCSLTIKGVFKMKKELQDKKFEHVMICSECGVTLPFCGSDGNHNFCPKSVENERIVQAYMKCKMKEIFAR